MRFLSVILAVSLTSAGAAFADDKKPAPPKQPTTGGSVDPSCNTPQEKMKTACTNAAQVRNLLKEPPPAPPPGKPIPYPNTGITTTAPVTGNN
jgi:hypothetical protein